MGCFHLDPNYAHNAGQTGLASLTPEICMDWCLSQSATYVYAGLGGGDNCRCYDAVPPEVHRVQEYRCNWPCAGYPDLACGGSYHKNVYERCKFLTEGSTPDHTVHGACQLCQRRLDDRGASLIMLYVSRLHGKLVYLSSMGNEEISSSPLLARKAILTARVQYLPLPNLPKLTAKLFLSPTSDSPIYFFISHFRVPHF